MQISAITEQAGYDADYVTHEFYEKKVTSLTSRQEYVSELERVSGHSRVMAEEKAFLGSFATGLSHPDHSHRQIVATAEGEDRPRLLMDLPKGEDDKHGEQKIDQAESQSMEAGGCIQQQATGIRTRPLPSYATQANKPLAPCLQENAEVSHGHDGIQYPEHRSKRHEHYSSDIIDHSPRGSGPPQHLTSYQSQAVARELEPDTVAINPYDAANNHKDEITQMLPTQHGTSSGQQGPHQSRRMQTPGTPQGTVGLSRLAQAQDVLRAPDSRKIGTWDVAQDPAAKHRQGAMPEYMGQSFAGMSSGQWELKVPNNGPGFRPEVTNTSAGSSRDGLENIPSQSSSPEQFNNAIVPGHSEVRTQHKPSLFPPFVGPQGAWHPINSARSSSPTVSSNIPLLTDPPLPPDSNLRTDTGLSDHGALARDSRVSTYTPPAARPSSTSTEIRPERLTSGVESDQASEYKEVDHPDRSQGSIDRGEAERSSPQFGVMSLEDGQHKRLSLEEAMKGIPRESVAELIELHEQALSHDNRPKKPKRITYSFEEAEGEFISKLVHDKADDREFSLKDLTEATRREFSERYKQRGMPPRSRTSIRSFARNYDGCATKFKSKWVGRGGGDGRQS